MTPPSSYLGKTAYHGQVAENYDRDRVGEPIWQQEQAWVENWARAIPEGATVLDLPAGTGRFIGLLQARGARVHAVDISEDMLAALRARWQPQAGGLVVARGDAEALEYPDRFFDFVLCWRLFHLLPPGVAERVAAELARVCRGRIAVEVFGAEPGGAVVGSVRLAWRRLKALLPRRGPAKPWSHITNYPHREQALVRMFTRHGLRLAGIASVADYGGRPATVLLLERPRPDESSPPA
jgi:ubiquinone/menaquinone biosynthesis C-methylase UbiE